MKARHRKRALDKDLRALVARFMWPGCSIKEYMRVRVLASRRLARIRAKIQERLAMLKNRKAA